MAQASAAPSALEGIILPAGGEICVQAASSLPYTRSDLSERSMEWGSINEMPVRRSQAESMLSTGPKVTFGGQPELPTNLSSSGRLIAADPRESDNPFSPSAECALS